MCTSNLRCINTSNPANNSVFKSSCATACIFSRLRNSAAVKSLVSWPLLHSSLLPDDFIFPANYVFFETLFYNSYSLTLNLTCTTYNICGHGHVKFSVCFDFFPILIFLLWNTLPENNLLPNFQNNYLSFATPEF